MEPGHPYVHPGTLVPQLVIGLLGGANPRSILSVGGGAGTPGQHFWATYGVRMTILDIYPVSNPPAGVRVVQGNALDAVDLLGADKHDVVICGDMIEHLVKEDGVKLIGVLEQVAERLVVYTTPNGFTYQDPATSPDEPWAGNPYQKHLCGWSAKEFLQFGYTVFMNGISEYGTSDGSQIVAWRKLT